MNILDLTSQRQRDIERLLIASALIGPVDVMRACGWLNADILQDERIKKLWAVLKERVSLAMDESRATDIAVQAGLEIIGQECIGWMQEVYNHADAPAYAQEIARRAYLARVAQGIPKLAGALANSDDAAARAVIAELSQQSIQTAPTFPMAMDIADRFEKMIRSGSASIQTFMPKIDSSMGGLDVGALTILAARPSVGKTALALQIARNSASSGRRVMFFSLEMSGEQLWARVACPAVGVTWRDYKSGKLNSSQVDDMISEGHRIAIGYEDRLVIDDERRHTTATMWRAVGEYKPDLVIVDHIRILRDKHVSEVKRLGIITDELKSIAKGFGCAVFAMAQLNRASESRDNRRPTLADLRDSGEIEENADSVWMLHRENDQAGRMINETELWGRKDRQGQRDVCVIMNFDPRQEWFL